MKRRTLFAGLAALIGAGAAATVAKAIPDPAKAGYQPSDPARQAMTTLAMPAHTHSVSPGPHGAWVNIGYAGDHSHSWMVFEEPVHSHSIRLF